MGMEFIAVEPLQVPPDSRRYRLTVQAMAAVRALLTDCGVLSLEPAKEPPPIPPGIRDHMDGVRAAMAGDVAAFDKLPKPYSDFITALQQRRSARSPASTQVPLFKFQSNEEWRVVPEECRLLARALRAQALTLSPTLVSNANRAANTEHTRHLQSQSPQWTREDFAEMLNRWADFNELAAQAGGYYVK